MELKQGIFQGISFEDYLKIPALNSSYLKELIPVPAYALIPHEDTIYKKIGRATHTYTLEPKLFWNYYIVSGLDLAGNSKKGKANLAALLMEYCGLTEEPPSVGYKDWVMKKIKDKTGKDVLSTAQYGIIKQMDKVIHSHPTAGQYLKAGRAELTIVWKDPGTGLWCKGRIDFIPTWPELIMLDLKSTKNADKYMFRRDVEYMKYFWSSGFYVYGWYVITGAFCEKFSYIAIEKEPPYRTEVRDLSQNHLILGIEKMQQALAIEVECRKNDFWPPWENAGSDELPMSQYLEGDES